MLDVFTSPPPQIRVELVKEFLYTHYNISASIEKLSSDRDLNYKVSSVDKSFVMKIANSYEDKNILEMQNMALKYISFQHKSFEVPIPIKSNEKKEISVIEYGNSKNYVRLLTYIEGAFLKDVEQNNQMLFSVGEFLGKLDHTLEGFEHKSSKRKFIWDAAQIDILSSQINHSKDDKTLIEFFINSFKDNVYEGINELSKGIIHNDGNDHNVIIGSNGKIKSIIDYGDMIYSLQALEPAVCMAYTAMSQKSPFNLIASILKGYQSSNALSIKDLESVIYLMCLRMCVTINMSVYRKKLFPENDYISISEKSARDFLRDMRDDNIQMWSKNLCEYVKS